MAGRVLSRRETTGVALLRGGGGGADRYQRRGSILADEMGLGKTVQAVTAAAASPPRRRQWEIHGMNGLTGIYGLRLNSFCLDITGGRRRRRRRRLPRRRLGCCDPGCCRGGLRGRMAGAGAAIIPLARQVGLMAWLYSSARRRGPFLVVAPLSTIPNWLREVALSLPPKPWTTDNLAADGRRWQPGCCCIRSLLLLGGADTDGAAGRGDLLACREAAPEHPRACETRGRRDARG